MLAIALLPVVFAAARPASPLYEGNCQSPSWSPDGAKLSWEVNYHDKKTIELYVYSPGKGPPRRIQPPVVGATSLTAGFSTQGGESVSHEIAWSPPSLFHFVYSASTGTDYDLYLDSGGALAASPGVDGGPAWSPDGRSIAFSSARTGQGDLYLLDVQAPDTPPRRLTTTPDASELYAAWSPDSTSLAYVSHTVEGDELFVLHDLANPSPQRLTSGPHTSTRPRWSPDGRSIAYYADSAVKDRFDLMLVAASGGAPRLLASGVVMDARGPSWTPDSARVVYVKEDENQADPVMQVPIADPSKAAVVPTATLGNSDLDVARGTDGRTWLAVTAVGREGDLQRTFTRIYVMELGN